MSGALVALAALVPSAPPALAQGVVQIDEAESARRLLRSAVIESQDGRHLQIISALGLLRDPRLRPFFQSIANDESLVPITRVEALAALAALDDDRCDPLLIEEIEPGERRAVLAAIATRNLLDRPELESIARWPDLDPLETVFVAIEAKRVGLDPLAMRLDLAAASEQEDLLGAIVASIFLGPDTTARIDELLALQAEMGRMQRSAVAIGVSISCAEARDPNALPVLARYASDQTLTRSARLSAVQAALEIDLVKGRPIWDAAVDAATSAGDRLRLASLGVTTGLVLETLPGPLASSEEVTARVAEILLIDGADRAGALVELLLAGGDAVSGPAAFTAIDRMEPSTRDGALARLVAEAIEDRVIVSGEAAASLAGYAPDLLAEAVRTRRDRPRTWVEAVALGLLAASPPPPSPASIIPNLESRYEEDDDRRRRSIWLLVLAHGDNPLDDEKLADLAIVASGGGRVSISLRAQAAWLWFVRTNRAEATVAALLERR